MKDTVTIRILRDAYIEENSDVALIRLDSIEHKMGQPVMVSYYNTNGDVEYIIAIGTKNGVGKDCYSIISTSTEEVINGVVDLIPDVSELVNDAVYICKIDEKWSKVFIWEQTIKRTEPLDETKTYIFKDISTGFRWFWSRKKFYREDDFISRQEVQEKIDSIRPERVFTASFQRGVVHLKGTKLLEPVLNIQIKEGALDVTDKYLYTVQSTSHGSHETIKSIEGNIMILYKTAEVTSTYTITATLSGTEENEEPEILTTTCNVVFVPYTLYITSKTSDIPLILQRDDFNEVLWGGLDDLKIDFNNMNLDYTVIMIPSDILVPDQIIDKHGLDYKDDYNVVAVEYSGENYNMLLKKDAVSIGSFKQILKHE